MFPLRPNGKEPPPGLRWRERSTTDLDRIGRYAAVNPDANWGCDLGKSGLFVVDVDCKRKVGDRYVFDPAGYDSFIEATGAELPMDGSTVATGSGGLHWYLTQPEVPVRGRTSQGFLPLIDVKSAGGYVVLPGSRTIPPFDHPCADGEYRVEHGLHLTPQLPPERWLALLAPPPPFDAYEAAVVSLRAVRGGPRGAAGHLRRLAGEVAGARPPGRNEVLNRAAFCLRDEVEAGLLGVRDVTDALRDACEVNGLARDDGWRSCLATIASGLGFGGSL